MKNNPMPDGAEDAQWQAAAAAIAAAQSILVVSHIAPDGDAVGSLLGLVGALRAGGKGVTAAIDDGVPAYLQFIPHSETILRKAPAGEYDLMIAVDSSDIERIGVAGAYGLAHSQRAINMDHHPTNTRYADINLIVPGAVAAAEIVFDFLNYCEWDISADIAHALLTGLITDSQGFRISATTSRTLEIAQTLMQAGAPLSQIMANTLNRRAYEEVELWKRVLPTVRLKDGLITAVISQAHWRDAGLEATGDGGLVSHLVNVDRARVSVVFKELPHDRVEISFRSKPGYDVAELALSLGGGGHKLASGCTLAGSLAQAQARVLPLARQVIAEGSGALE